MDEEKKSQISLSVCLIVKNEQKNIGTCLASIKDLADEIIIADTGSEDKTVEIIKSFGIEPLHFDWVKDFSAAKNFVLSKATKDWILVLDGDECLAKRDHQYIREAISYEYDCIKMTKRSYVNFSDYLHFVSNDNSYEEGKGFLGWIPEPNDLLFRNLPGIKFEGVIHETVGKSVRDLKLRMAEILIPIHHYGRHDMSKKNLLYKELVDKRIHDDENDALAWYYKGTHSDWDNLSEIAEECFQKSYNLSKRKDTIFGLALTKLKLKKWNEAEKLFTEYLSLDINEVQGWKNLIQIVYLQKRYDKCFSLIAKFNSLELSCKGFNLFLADIHDKMGLHSFASYYRRKEQE
jgi:glycosyltransferase involved in cell wall biosynthesis